jgi:3-hydroxybutyryl-CoA dehydrogenase
MLDVRSADDGCLAPPRLVAVLGLGTMGQGIALLCALSGLETRVFEIDAARAQSAHAAMMSKLARLGEREKRAPEETRAIGERITVARDLEQACAGADLIIEAIPESMEAKSALFAQVKNFAPAPAVLASNTSGLSISELGGRVAEPQRILGLHFFNPPTAMDLLEVVKGKETDEKSIDRALAFARLVGKTAILVHDSPGFATSRLGVMLGVEAMRMVEEGVASVTDIDRAMELGYRHPMGPLKVSDLVGLDVRLAILENLAKELGDRFRPPSILRKLVAGGRLGKKVGLGFYRWTDAGPVPEP